MVYTKHTTCSSYNLVVPIGNESEASEQSTGATIALTLTIIPVTAAIIVLVIVILRLQKRRQSVNEELVPEPVTENLYVIQEDSKK